MKCLEKDRTRRYETANGLAADLKRHLNNETGRRAPAEFGVSFSETGSPQQARICRGVAIAAALLFGIIVTTWQAIRATRAKREALAAQANESVSQRIKKPSSRKPMKPNFASKPKPKNSPPASAPTPRT